MELEKQVCSLELAKKLNALGAKQESQHYWCKHNAVKNRLPDPWLLLSPDIQNRRAAIYREAYPHASMYAAFTVAELGEMLPKGMVFVKENFGWTCRIDASCGTTLTP